MQICIWILTFRRNLLFPSSGFPEHLNLDKVMRTSNLTHQIIRVIIRGTNNTRMGTKNMYAILVGNHHGRRPLRRSMNRWEGWYYYGSNGNRL
jgi:hypothetical protein